MGLVKDVLTTNLLAICYNSGFIEEPLKYAMQVFNGSDVDGIYCIFICLD